MHAMVNGKMHPEYKEKWLAALRSGEFKQGRNQLCTRKGELLGGQVLEEDRYCCLGVLNQVLDLGCADDEAALYKAEASGERRSLPILDTIVVNRLVAMNDSEDQSFAQIADWIEANL